MDRANLQSLLTPVGQSALAHAAELEPTEGAFLSALTKLQKHYPNDLARAALETVLLRRKARVKFTRADSMYFTRDGLEMASSEIVSRYRSARFAPFALVADLGCGIGGDTIGLALSLPRPGDIHDGGTLWRGQPSCRGSVAGDGGQGKSDNRNLTAFDINSLHLDLAKQNLAAYGLQADFIELDLTREKLPAAEAAFFDPGRRVAGRRRFSVRDYQPPLSLIDSWFPLSLGVKISPGVKLNEVERYDCEFEFISLDGELKECVLWFGPLRTTCRRSTIIFADPPIEVKGVNLPSPNLHTVMAFDSSHTRAASASLTSPLPLASPVTAAPLSAPRSFLYEPDPAILRAGLVADLADQLNAAQLDPDIAYLTSDVLTPTPFARAYAVEAALPFSQKRLREALRAMNVGRVTVKKRGSPLEPESFARSLRLKGEEERIVFLTHVQGKPYALIGARVL